jgi:hypothetical protein
MALTIKTAPRKFVASDTSESVIVFSMAMPAEVDFELAFNAQKKPPQSVQLAGFAEQLSPDPSHEPLQSDGLFP